MTRCQLCRLRRTLKPGSAVCITGANDGIGALRPSTSRNKAMPPSSALARKPRRTRPLHTCKRRRAARSRLESPLTSQALRVSRAVAMPFAPLPRNSNAAAWPTSQCGRRPTERRIPADGLEEGIQVCHVSHFMLTQDLLPDLSEGGEEARVVTVSSSAHALAPGVDLSDQTWSKRTFDATTAYGESKLANLLFAVELASRAPSMVDGGRITSLALHPGVVATSLFKEFTPQQSGWSLHPLRLPQLESALEGRRQARRLAKLRVRACPRMAASASCYALLRAGAAHGRLSERL